MADPRAQAPFRTDIEGLRAIAVLGVVLFHAGVPVLGGGYVGVDVFYVISGFLITQIMLRDATTETRPGLGRFLLEFYARRVRRILPAATLVMLATLAGALIVHNALENAGVDADARSTTLFFSNLRFAAHASDYFAAGDAPSVFLQYWSLSLEEQFYILWPIVFFVLLALGRARGTSRRAIAIGLAIVVIGSFALDLAWMQTESIRAFYLLPARAWELGIGALIAVHEPRLGALAPRVRAAMAWIGFAAIASAMLLFTAATPFPGWAASAPTIGTALVVAAGCGTGTGGVLAAALGSRPMRWIGRYSFSIYLWHWPVLTLKVEHFAFLYAQWPIRTAFALAASLPAAAVTYHLIENPIRRARALRNSPARSLAVGAVLTAIGLGAALAFPSLSGSSKLATDRLVAVSGGTLNGVSPTGFVPANLVPALVDVGDRTYVHCGRPCIVGSPTAKHHIILFGNSHAGHWGAAFDVARVQLDATVEIHGAGGCSSYLVPAALLVTKDPDGCTAIRERVFAQMAADPPDLVVFSNLTFGIFDTQRAVWERGVRDAIRRVPRRTKAVLFSETPRASFSVPLCLAANLEHAERCDQHWADALNDRLAQITREEGATFIDLRPIFCTHDRCPAITQDTLIYNDTDHITVAFSRAQGRWVGAALAPLLH